ncbi:muts domain V-domain-containing protein [Halteromyces radiatus]|uniref:muts domain V-domain-containing protein n=1 Tax=Halteromyces radiatus TaxID=101107 RepID=UPI002220838C|nr:muts domain V-domain-containing protein [Halteromyces radiatus]KAI8098718.1 muts domain V-domain-containing protein [Halteromyces radiatus]
MTTESLAVRDRDQPSHTVKQDSSTSPSTANDDNDDNDDTDTRKSRRSKKRIIYAETDDDDDEGSDNVKDIPHSDNKPRKRRSRRVIEDDDSSDEFKLDITKDHDEDDDYDDGNFDCTMDSDDDIIPATAMETEPQISPIQERFRGRNKAFKEKNDVRYSWLANPKDANGNPPDSPDYDPRTLYVPPSAWKNFTPFEKQFWEIKSKQWDSVVFFKKGKFYELYEKDADIGHQDFDLKMTDRVNMRMVGVPESSFDYWAAQFIARGHKVARVDQMENAIGKSMRDRQESKTKSKEDKVIRRELTSVLTAGTLVDAGLLTDDMGTYCMAIKEYCPSDQSDPLFGICFVDTSTAEFNLVTFQDDRNRTNFETLIMQIKPRELVTEKGRLSADTSRILKNCLNNPIWNMLIPESEFWDDRVTADEIRIGAYFTQGNSNDDLDSMDSWPTALQTAAKTPVLLSAIGGLIWYLRSLKLDKELLSARNFHPYDPLQNATSLVLDGQTLANLEIFENSFDGSTDGTVFKLLANSITPFGKRLFKRWLCHPLRQLNDIKTRQDAVEDLMNMPEIHERISTVFAELPDLERLISRIHSKRCKVSEFLLVLDGFKKAKTLIDWLSSVCPSFESVLLKTLVTKFPPINDQLEYFGGAFIIAEVDIDYQKMTAIIPKQGVNKDWDDINDDLKGLEKAFATHLAQMKLELKSSRLEYKDLGKEIYQIEVPKNITVPKDWIRMSSTSKVNRYWNATLRELVTQYKEHLEIKNAYTKNFANQVYSEFDEHYDLWLDVVKHLAHLDALLGLCKGSSRLGEPSCRPEFTDQETSVLEFEELRHPCIVSGATTDFIPNDTTLGGEDRPNIMVLTGPNMGGKSTLLRQTCVAIIMAQLGGYVPAKACRMTACDRIYTRIGANDNILAGQSTFMVELAETSKILHEATPRSMVILDELGRGTSTFDGYSIAYAVLHYLATHVGCLAMFSTHYHTLCREFERNPSIKNMHM